MRSMRKAAGDAEARVAVLESEMVRHRDEATSLSEELEAFRDAYDMDRRRSGGMILCRLKLSVD